jgi:signal transduction histidine kinase
MLNGVNLNYIVVLLVTGSVLLAAVYHTILYSHRRTSLLASYSIYLWSTFVYCLFRTIFFTSSNSAYRFFNPDEVLQMISFVMYIRFAAGAMDLHKEKDRHALLFTQLTPYVMGCYLLLNTVLVNVSSDVSVVYFTAKIVIRTYLLLLGLLILLTVALKRRSLFYRYLAAGAISMIFCGLISSLINIAGPEIFLLGALSWLMFGFFLDVIFFSAAIGFRIRQEYKEKENSLKELLQKEAELQQKELEKMRVVYETREEERMRIARDLHDDMGSTLSSIGIYANVVTSYMDSDKEKAKEYLHKIQANSKLVMENTADLIWSLQTNYGQDESIYKRMHKTAVEMLSSAGITPRIQIAPAEELPSLHIVAQKNCWLIFKEAINNVCKYSKASNCIISIKKEEEKLIMNISDDGTGFENPMSGNGLANMRTRTAELDGELMLQSQCGSGTRLIAVFLINKIAAV